MTYSQVVERAKKVFWSQKLWNEGRSDQCEMSAYLAACSAMNEIKSTDEIVKVLTSAIHCKAPYPSLDWQDVMTGSWHKHLADLLASSIVTLLEQDPKIRKENERRKK